MKHHIEWWSNDTSGDPVDVGVEAETRVEARAKLSAALTKLVADAEPDVCHPGAACSKPEAKHTTLVPTSLTEALAQHATMLANLTDVQKRCTELTEELRAERAKSSGPALTVQRRLDGTARFRRDEEYAKLCDDTAEALSRATRLFGESSEREILRHGIAEGAEYVRQQIIEMGVKVAAWGERAEMAENDLRQIHKLADGEGLTPYGAVNHLVQLMAATKARAERAEVQLHNVNNALRDRLARFAPTGSYSHDAFIHAIADGVLATIKDAEEKAERLAHQTRAKTDHSGCQRETQRMKEAHEKAARHEKTRHEGLLAAARAETERWADIVRRASTVATCATGDLPSKVLYLRERSDELRAEGERRQKAEANSKEFGEQLHRTRSKLEALEDSLNRAVAVSVTNERQYIAGKLEYVCGPWSAWLRRRIAAQTGAGEPDPPEQDPKGAPT